MAGVRFRSNRKYPTPITVTDDLRSHTLALQSIVEALAIGQRRTNDLDNSFVRLHELVDIGLVEIVNGQLKLTNLGSTVVSGGSGGTFIGLTDTPASYAAAAGDFVRVNGAADALIFADITASLVGYDNSTSSLNATDVQDAIDELDAAIDYLQLIDPHAGEIDYSNATSGLTATNVQAAIDEIATIAGIPAIPVVKYGQSDTTRTTTSLASDSDLDVTLDANTDYVVRYMIPIETNSTADLKWAFAFTGTVTSAFVLGQNNNATTASVASGTTSTGVNGFISASLTAQRTHIIAGTDTCVLELTVNIRVGASGGTLQWTWAQNTASGTSTRRRDASVVVFKAS